MQDELRQEIIVSDEVVLTVLAPLKDALMEWYRAQSQAMLKGRLEPQDFAMCMDFLCGEGTVRAARYPHPDRMAWACFGGRTRSG